jgi:hypothetical protein
MASGAPAAKKGRGTTMVVRRIQLLRLIDEINREHGHGANYRDLGGRLGLCVSYVRTLMLEHQRGGFAEPIAGSPYRGWRLTDAGRKQLKAG